jgi:hypothetical protein
MNKLKEEFNLKLKINKGGDRFIFGSRPFTPNKVLGATGVLKQESRQIFKIGLRKCWILWI